MSAGTATPASAGGTPPSRYAAPRRVSTSGDFSEPAIDAADAVPPTSSCDRRNVRSVTPVKTTSATRMIPVLLRRTLDNAEGLWLGVVMEGFPEDVGVVRETILSDAREEGDR